MFKLKGEWDCGRRGMVKGESATTTEQRDGLSSLFDTYCSLRFLQNYITFEQLTTKTSKLFVSYGKCIINFHFHKNMITCLLLSDKNRTILPLFQFDPFAILAIFKSN